VPNVSLDISLNVASALCFAGFVALALSVLHAERVRPEARRRRLTAFLTYSLVVSFGAGLTGHDAWPFSDWPLAAGRVGHAVTTSRIVAVGASGAEHPVDARAWQPLVYDELNPWLHLRLPTLSSERREGAARFLLAHVEEARRRARAGGGVGYFDRFLGPFAAPYFVLHPKTWPAEAPEEPFVGLRVYLESWNVRDRAGDPSAITRSLSYEYRSPAARAQ